MSGTSSHSDIEESIKSMCATSAVGIMFNRVWEVQVSVISECQGQMAADVALLPTATACLSASHCHTAGDREMTSE